MRVVMWPSLLVGCSAQILLKDNGYNVLDHMTCWGLVLYQKTIDTVSSH